MFSFYHLPSVLDYIKLDETLHGIYTFVLFMSALFMYWPLLNTVEGETRMKDWHKFFYLIANAILITPSCALIIFSSTPFYKTYTDGETWMKAMALCVPTSTLQGLTLSGPELFTNMTPLEDQQLGSGGSCGVHHGTGAVWKMGRTNLASANVAQQPFQ